MSFYASPNPLLAAHTQFSPFEIPTHTRTNFPRTSTVNSRQPPLANDQEPPNPSTCLRMIPSLSALSTDQWPRPPCAVSVIVRPSFSLGIARQLRLDAAPARSILAHVLASSQVIWSAIPGYLRGAMGAVCEGIEAEDSFSRVFSLKNIVGSNRSPDTPSSRGNDGFGDTKIVPTYSSRAF
jgi:hypothetical protein